MNYKLSLLLVSIVSTVFSFKINAQVPQLPDTTLVCLADSVMLDAGSDFENYYWWNTGEQTQTIWVKENDLYIVSCDTLIDSTRVFFQKAKIEQGDTIHTCYSYPITLSVDRNNLKYLWNCDDPNYVIKNDSVDQIEVVPEKDTTIFYVTISDDNMTCVDKVVVILYSRFTFDKVKQIYTGCPLPPSDTVCAGQLEVIVSGGFPPYSYFWKDSLDPYRKNKIFFIDSICYGLCEKKYYLRVSDQMCARDTFLDVKVLDMPVVTISYLPEDVYIKNPVVNFSVDDQSIMGWNWNFGDNTYSTLKEPVKVFDSVKVYNVWLKYTTSDECVDSVKIDVDVKEVKLKIPNIFTPNTEDDINPLWVIENLEYYMSNEVMVFNRYGKKVYSKTNYASDWDGDNLRDGAYFYVLKAKGYFGLETYRGSVTIIRR
jgi:gliding motility-associated-like protein